MAEHMSDTTADAQAVQLELLRGKSPNQKFSMLCSLTHTAMFHAKRALRRANPELDALSLQLRFIEIHYGVALALEVAENVRSRRECPNRT